MLSAYAEYARHNIPVTVPAGVVTLVDWQALESDESCHAAGHRNASVVATEHR